MSAPQYDVPSGTTTSYYLRNPHGDVVGLTQAGASVNIAATTYDPWGSVVGAASSNGAGSTLGFQGQVTDRATGMTKTDTRFYDPSQGRFTAQDVLFGDPMDAGSLNQYAYANGNPVTLNDPTGMAAPQKCAVMGMTWCANHYDEWRAAKLARLRAQDLATSQYSFALGCFCEDRTVPHVFISDAIGTNYLRLQLKDALADLDEDRINKWGHALEMYTDDSGIFGDQVLSAELGLHTSPWDPVNLREGAADRRWQIASGVVAATCVAAAIPTGPGGAGAAGTACYAGTAGLLGAKEASVVKSHVPQLGGDGDWGALGRDTTFNVVTAACSAIPGFGPTCGVLFTLDPEMAGPHWDE